MVKGGHAVLGTDAGLARAAKRHFDRGDVVIVDPANARFELGRHTVALLQICGEHAGSQAKAGMVGAGNGLLFGIKDEHSQHRTEDFLLGDGGAGEIAGAPDLIVEIEGRDPVVGKLGEFPSEVGDVVFTGAEVFPVVVVQVAGGGRVEVDDVDVVGIRVGEAGDVGGRRAGFCS